MDDFRDMPEDVKAQRRQVAKIVAPPAVFEVILGAVTEARKAKYGARDTAAHIQNAIVMAAYRGQIGG